MSGARGVPQGRDRNIADADLQTFKDRVDKLRAEGLPMSAISERLGTSATTIHHRLKRLKDLIAKEGEKIAMANDEIIENVSAKVHETWMETKRTQGVSSRKSEKGEELMVPYSDLSEEAKNLDRGSVKATLDAMNAAGFSIVKKSESNEPGPEKKPGSGFTALSIVNELRTVRIAAFKAQLTKMIRPAGRGGFSKKQVEDMTSGFESGFSDVFVCLVDMGVISIDSEQ